MFGFVARSKAACQFGIHHGVGAFGDELSHHAEVWFAFEVLNFAFAFNNQSHSHALHTSSRQRRLDFLPEHRRKFETHNAVEHAPSLLSVDDVDVDVARVFDGIQEGRLGDFVKHDALRVFVRKPEHFVEVPCYGFTFAVLIGSQPHHFGLLSLLLQCLHQVAFVRRNLVDWSEAVVDVDAEILFVEIADVTFARHHFIVVAKKLAYVLYLRWRFDNY